MKKSRFAATKLGEFSTVFYSITIFLLVILSTDTCVASSGYMAISAFTVLFPVFATIWIYNGNQCITNDLMLFVATLTLLCDIGLFCITIINFFSCVVVECDYESLVVKLPNFSNCECHSHYLWECIVIAGLKIIFAFGAIYACIVKVLWLK